MGGHPYWYVVPYEADLQVVLDKLREREHRAGRYNPVIPFPEFEEPAFSAQHPGARHETIAAALEASAEDGTRSILDIATVAKAPDFGVAAPASLALIAELCGTRTPTPAQVEEIMFDLFAEVDRGHCLYVVLYEGAAPSAVLFVGYSYD